PTIPAVSSQGASLFLSRTPQEIRDLIYNHVFATTNNCFGKGSFDEIESSSLSPNALALLRICRQINQEIRKSWIRQVCFFFRGVDTMHLKLAHVPESLVSQIRYMCVREKQVAPFLRASSPSICDALAAIPALRLDLLFVLGFFNEIADLDNLNPLINESDGWRELRYLTHGANYMFQHGPPFQHVVPPPAIWQETLMRRDEPGSESSVVLYR
ncbi:hypothetical protein QBC37DRAFT_244445, partial [Rhypophila decipiens]